MGSSSSLKKSSLVTTTTGNALAQFMIFSALTCVAYQFLVTQLIDSPSVQVDVPLTSSHSLKRNVPAPTPWIDSTALEKHRETRKETTSTTEFSCFVACVGLFGLMQRKKQRSEIEARIKAQRHILTNDRTDLIPSTSSTTTVVDRFGDVPLDVKIQVLLYLEPRELVVCSMVNTAWHEAVGDSAEILWKLVFQRDFGETGERFTAIFPRFCWRQYYFFHHLSRPVEIARWMGQTQDRQCVVVQGRVYDVTTFLDRHPGGRHVLGDVIGSDATDVWEQFQHSNDAQEMMKEFLVDDVVLKQIGKKKLNGNLKIVYRRWRLVLWCIGYAHLFGHFSIWFMDVTLWLANWRTKVKAKVFSI